jgi:hypothetical protein
MVENLLKNWGAASGALAPRMAGSPSFLINLPPNIPREKCHPSPLDAQLPLSYNSLSKEEI